MPSTTAATIAVPAFRVDASWPKPLPNNWVIGPVPFVSVDARNHVWIVQRPKLIPAGVAGVPAPPVLEFDQQGALMQAWGGPGPGYDWPLNEHGFHVDPQSENVWVGGVDAADTQVLKFSRDGKFLLQIGRPGQKLTNTDTTIAKAGDMRVDPKANEIYVADGEAGNRRVIVFDADTGAFKRQWGAYGDKPIDGPPPKYDPAAPPQRVFGDTVHCVDLSADGLVYVCDRNYDRFQVFRTDGSFVKEAIMKLERPADVAISPDRKFLYVAGADKVWILIRDSLEVVRSFGEAGAQPGQFQNLHSIAVDRNGNLYTSEVNGRRVQKFELVRP